MVGDERRPFPEDWDPDYFAARPWAARVRSWLASNPGSFAAGNEAVVRQMLQEPETGLRVVVNISADALLSFLAGGRYLNLYEKPLIGDVAPTASKERMKVDALLGIGEQTYFGAVALGGTGVRFYGEYCMVLKLAAHDPEVTLFDRDSYDVVQPPLSSLDLDGEDLVDVLGGTWSSDVVSMALMRVLPQVDNASRLVTSGTVSEAILRDQEFIEVHLGESFGPEDLEEVRQSPDEASIDLTIAERRRNSLLGTLVEAEWVRRRAAVARALDESNVQHRIVTLHGRGYQWK